MITAIVEPYDFLDIKDLPKVHSDERRTISEKIDESGNGIKRTTRIVVNMPSVVLGNHYHDFSEQFTGIGTGKFYSSPISEPGDISVQNLPEKGWKVTVPAGIVHAFSVHKNAILISTADKMFQDGVNTHSTIIANA